MAQNKEEEKNILETALEGLQSEISEDAVEREETLTDAVYKVWGEDEDTQEAEDSDSTKDIDEEEDDGIQGTKEPDEGPDDAKVMKAGGHKPGEVMKDGGHKPGEKADDDEDKDEAYMNSDMEDDEDDEKSEGMYDDDEDPSDEDSKDEGMHGDDEEDDEEKADDAEDDADDVKMDADDAEDDMEDEAEDEIVGKDDDMGEEEDDDMDEEEDDDTEDEAVETDMDDEDDGIDGTKEPDDDVDHAIEQVSSAITSVAAKKAMEKIEAKKVDMKEDIEALCAGDETLTEEFKSKVSTIFEAAVSSKVREEVEQLREDYASTVVEEVESLHSDLIEKIDQYLTYVAEQWVEENEVAVENILRTQIAESFMSSMKENFINHYIEMPEGKTDMFDELQEKCTEFENKVTELEEVNSKLESTLIEQSRKDIVREASEGLVDTQAAKFKSLVEELKFESTDKFKEKVSLIKESYFSNKKSVKKEESKKESNSNTVETVIVEEVEKSTSDPLMDAYIKAAVKQTRDAQ